MLEQALLVNYQSHEYNFTDYMKLYAAQVADENGEICKHWNSNRMRVSLILEHDEEPIIPIYNTRRIRIIFDEAIDSISSPSEIHIECLSCNKLDICQKPRFPLTTQAILKKIQQYQENPDLMELMLT